MSEVEKIWSWFSSIEEWNGFTGILARIAIAVFTVYFVFRGLVAILELLLKFQSTWATAGLPWFHSSETRNELRQRAQFSNVLRSDLAVIAKAESWNDQYFTDLEAEVEIEGNYYSTFRDRIMRRSSHGKKRVPSLVQAIEDSSAKCLQLVGEPGSGKSVALRHLGVQLASRAIKSQSLKARVPLYVNLRELNIEGVPSADSIKKFVFDNIRRGDADTSDFVKKHWDTYRKDGIWFFLFDSFDEIPDVLHAPSGSPLLKQYSEAIRQFMDGLGPCRGILASREFKGPESLPWDKFRILPLSKHRQIELIDNSFLGRDPLLRRAESIAELNLWLEESFDKLNVKSDELRTLSLQFLQDKKSLSDSQEIGDLPRGKTGLLQEWILAFLMGREHGMSLRRKRSLSHI